MVTLWRRCAGLMVASIGVMWAGGAVGDSPAARIVNGQPASIQDYPWMVVVQFPQGSCSGFLVNPQFVMTAKHCVKDGSAAEVWVDAGGANVNAPLEQVAASAIYSVAGRDIALIRLEQAFSISGSIRPIALGSRRVVPQGVRVRATVVTIMGYGSAPVCGAQVGGAMGNARVLRAATTQITEVTDNVLETAYLALSDGTTAGAALDSGDSGSPMVITDRGDGRAALGVASTSSVGPVCPTPGMIVARLSQYERLDDATVQWACDLMRGTGATNPGCSPSVRRTVVLDRSGRLTAADGPQTLQNGSQWTRLNDTLPTALRVVSSGDWVGFLDGNGNFRVKAGALNAPWVVVATDVNTAPGVSGIALTNIGNNGDLDRVGYIDRAGNLHVKSGGLNTQWTNALNEPGTLAKQIVLSGDRVGYLDTSGNFRVKAGALNVPWVLVATDVSTGGGSTIALSSTASNDALDRLGYIDGNGNVRVKSGGLNTQWTNVLNEPGTFGYQIVLSGNRAGYLDTSGNLRVKVGALDAPWVLEYQGCQQGVLASDGVQDDLDRIGCLDRRGHLLVKSGGMSTAWTDLAFSNMGVAVSLSSY